MCGLRSWGREESTSRLWSSRLQCRGLKWAVALGWGPNGNWCLCIGDVVKIGAKKLGLCAMSWVHMGFNSQAMQPGGGDLREGGASEAEKGEVGRGRPGLEVSSFTDPALLAPALLPTVSHLLPYLGQRLEFRGHSFSSGILPCSAESPPS